MTALSEISSRPIWQRRVLIFDNNRHVSEPIRRVFEHQGFPVRVVLTREELNHALRVEHPDIVVLDLAAREVDAAPVFRAICESCPSANLVPSNGPASAIPATNHRLGESMGRRRFSPTVLFPVTLDRSNIRKGRMCWRMRSYKAGSSSGTSPRSISVR